MFVWRGNSGAVGMETETQVELLILSIARFCFREYSENFHLAVGRVMPRFHLNAINPRAQFQLKIFLGFSHLNMIGGGIYHLSQRLSELERNVLCRWTIKTHLPRVTYQKCELFRRLNGCYPIHRPSLPIRLKI
jgi:hypothetical protein